TLRIRDEVSVVIEPNLPLLYTWDFTKNKYKRILNTNGKMCKSYPGGLFLREFNNRGKSIYVPVHKPKGAA
ncbi:8605_t:CDS:1, partial [Racocetra fulgida]